MYTKRRRKENSRSGVAGGGARGPGDYTAANLAVKHLDELNLLPLGLDAGLVAALGDRRRLDVGGDDARGVGERLGGHLVVISWGAVCCYGE